MTLRHSNLATQNDAGAGRREAPAEISDDPDSTGMPSAAPTVAVDVRVADWRKEAPDIEDAVRQATLAALAASAPTGTAAAEIEVSVVLADDATVRRLNREYRGRDAATNVLAFPQGAAPEPGAGPLLLGDVVLAYETVRREAARQGKSVADHTRHLVIHGVLHLLGFDHDTEAAAAAMERRETALLAGLGVADPYADGGAP